MSDSLHDMLGDSRPKFLDFTTYILGHSRSHIGRLTNITSAQDQQLFEFSWKLFDDWQEWRQDVALEVDE